MRPRFFAVAQNDRELPRRAHSVAPLFDAVTASALRHIIAHCGYIIGKKGAGAQARKNFENFSLKNPKYTFYGTNLALSIGWKGFSQP